MNAGAMRTTTTPSFRFLFEGTDKEGCSRFALWIRRMEPFTEAHLPPNEMRHMRAICTCEPLRSCRILFCGDKRTRRSRIVAETIIVLPQ